MIIKQKLFFFIRIKTSGTDQCSSFTSIGSQHANAGGRSGCRREDAGGVGGRMTTCFPNQLPHCLKGGQLEIHLQSLIHSFSRFPSPSHSDSKHSSSLCFSSLSRFLSLSLLRTNFEVKNVCLEVWKEAVKTMREQVFPRLLLKSIISSNSTDDVISYTLTRAHTHTHTHTHTNTQYAP